MVLPKPAVPQQDKVAAAGEEVEGEGAFDQGAIDFLGPGPLEIRHRFEAAQAGLREAAFQAAAGGGGGFGAGDFFQQLAGTPAPGGGAGHQVVERVGGKEPDRAASIVRPDHWLASGSASGSWVRSS